jgi:transcriptional antiterminator NusG
VSYFVVSVRTGKENAFVTAGRKAAELRDVTFHWPRRRLTIRRKGKRIESLAPLFAGYVFIETETITEPVFRTTKRLPGFYRFLESNERIRPLSGSDLELVGHFIKLGEVIGKSQVTFDKDSRIEVKSGPLAGLEGKIVKVDRRKQRAKVRLDLYKESFLVDFGFELIGRAARSDS